ncbi:MAG: nucleoside deaminase [Phycisphaeraceae bacterium]|nr:nucleoside deaminase [Phycisphaeraceae bacterium]
MRRAVELAAHGVDAGHGGPFGCVIARGEEIVGEGWNQVVSSNDPTAHGEVVAIRAAAARLGRFSLAGCDLFTTGEPCPMCLGAIHWARIDAVHFALSAADIAAIGFDDRAFYEELAKPREARVLPVHAVSEELRQTAREVACRWLARSDRVPY